MLQIDASVLPIPRSISVQCRHSSIRPSSSTDEARCYSVSVAATRARERYLWVMHCAGRRSSSASDLEIDLVRSKTNSGRSQACTHPVTEHGTSTYPHRSANNTAADYVRSDRWCTKDRRLPSFTFKPSWLCIVFCYVSLCSMLCAVLLSVLIVLCSGLSTTVVVFVVIITPPDVVGRLSKFGAVLSWHQTFTLQKLWARSSARQKYNYQRLYNRCGTKNSRRHFAESSSEFYRR